MELGIHNRSIWWRITYNEEFLEKYGDYISASELGGSKLWDNIIEHRIKAIKKKILS